MKRIMNKTDFVRKHPDLTAAALIKLAAKQKVKLTTAHVYTIRSSLKRETHKNKAVARVLVPLKRPDWWPKVEAHEPKAGSFRSQIEVLCRRLIDDLLAAVRQSSLKELVQ